MIGRLGFDRDPLRFLGYSIELDSGKICDEIKQVYLRNSEILYKLLAHYSKAELTERTGKLVRFGDLPGGYAYESAFMRRAVFPLTEIFGSNVEMLVTTAKVLNGSQRSFGNASAEIPALPKVPLTYILWRATEEFQASASVLFDSSASNYLPTEDLAVLAELTTKRLRYVLYYGKRKLE